MGAEGFQDRCLKPLGHPSAARPAQRHLVSDLDIFRSANLLIKHHGQDAPIHAAMRADAMLETGDLGGYAVWKRIVMAELLSKERPDGATVQ